MQAGQGQGGAMRVADGTVAVEVYRLDDFGGLENSCLIRDACDVDVVGEKGWMMLSNLRRPDIKTEMIRQRYAQSQSRNRTTIKNMSKDLFYRC